MPSLVSLFTGVLTASQTIYHFTTTVSVMITLTRPVWLTKSRRPGKILPIHMPRPYPVPSSKDSIVTLTQRCCELGGGFVVQLLSHVWPFVTPWAAARQASLSIINSRSLLKLMSIESAMPSNLLILCHPLLLLPSIFPSIRVFSNESALHIRLPRYWNLSFSISPSSEYSGLIFFRIDWFDSLQSKGLSRVFTNTTGQKHQSHSKNIQVWFKNSHHT